MARSTKKAGPKPTANWLVDARDVVRKARTSDAQWLFFQPIFKGPAVNLTYEKYMLDTSDWTKDQKRVLRASGVPLDIRCKWKDWGGRKPRVLVVHGVIVNVDVPVTTKSGKAVKGMQKTQFFLATGASDGEGSVYHNQALTMNLLHCRGFITSLPYSGWMEPDTVNKHTLEERLALLQYNIRANKTLARLPEPVGIKLFQVTETD